MKLTLLGTGCPSVDHKRFGPSNLITTSKTKILIDCGSGVTQRLNQLKVSSAKIDAIFLTHLHSDHVIDFYQVIISSCFSNHIKRRNGIDYLLLLDSMDDFKKDYPSCRHAQLIHFQTNSQSILMIRDILSDWLSVTNQDQSNKYRNYMYNLSMP